MQPLEFDSDMLGNPADSRSSRNETSKKNPLAIRPAPVAAQTKPSLSDGKQAATMDLATEPQCEGRSLSCFFIIRPF